MSWETIPTLNRTRFDSMAEDEISIIKTKVKSSHVFRINMRRKFFGMDVKDVTIKWDKQKKRIGFFKTENPEKCKKLSSYAPGSNLVYVSMPKGIHELGFDTGRYKIKKKAEVPNMYFYIAAKKKVEDAEQQKEPQA